MQTFTIADVRDRRLWIPYMSDAAFVVIAVLRSIGIDAALLPRSPDPQLRLGRSHTDGDQCLPSIITTEDILQRVQSPDFDPRREAFFQGRAEGPCRLGRYYMNQQLILERLGFPGVPLLDFDVDNPECYRVLGPDFRLVAWNAFSAHAALESWLHRTRPIERHPGAAKAAYAAALARVCELFEHPTRRQPRWRTARILAGRDNRDLLRLLAALRPGLDAVETVPDARPRVLVTGEVFVRVSSVANQDLIGEIEALGGTVVLEPLTAFFSYTMLLPSVRRKHHVRDSSRGETLAARVELTVAERDARRIHAAVGVPAPVPAAEILHLGRRWVHETFEGEAIVTVGAIAHAAHEGLDGAINAMPHNCMPGLISTALGGAAAAAAGGQLPLLHLSYDGHVDPARAEQLALFMAQLAAGSGRARPARS